MTSKISNKNPECFFEDLLLLNTPILDNLGRIFTNQEKCLKEIHLETRFFYKSVFKNCENNQGVHKQFVDQVEKVGHHLIELYTKVQNEIEESFSRKLWHALPGLSPNCVCQIQRIEQAILYAKLCTTDNPQKSIYCEYRSVNCISRFKEPPSLATINLLKSI